MTAAGLERYLNLFNLPICLKGPPPCGDPTDFIKEYTGSRKEHKGSSSHLSLGVQRQYLLEVFAVTLGLPCTVQVHGELHQGARHLQECCLTWATSTPCALHGDCASTWLLWFISPAPPVTSEQFLFVF